MIGTNKKIIIATHGEDLDGRFSAELFKLAFPTEDKVFIYIPNNSNDTRFEYISKHKEEYTDIYIVDLEMLIGRKESKILLEDLLPSYTGTLHIIDHHRGSLEFEKVLKEKFPQNTECTIKVANEVGKPISAAYLVCEKFKLELYKNDNIDMHRLYKIIKAVSDWDTGTDDKYGNHFAKILQLYYSAVPVEIAAVKIAESCLESNEVSEEFVKIFCEGEEAYSQIYSRVVDFIKSSEITYSKLGRVLTIELPTWLKQEYKVPCLRDALKDTSLGIDYIILCEANAFRIYSEYEKFNAYTFVKYIFKRDDLIFRSNSYFSIRKEEVSEYLGLAKDAPWSEILSKIKLILAV